MTVLLIFVAFVYVIAGVVVGVMSLTALVSWISFGGIPLSKGADRGQAWSSLRAMLGRAPAPERSGSDTDPDNADESGR